MTYRIADDPTFEPAVTTIVRRVVGEETADMRKDIDELKTDVSQLKTDMKDVKDELTLMRVLHEENNGYLKDLLTITKESMVSKQTWQNHEGRIGKLEKTQAMIKETVTSHSRRLAQN